MSPVTIRGAGVNIGGVNIGELNTRLTGLEARTARIEEKLNLVLAKFRIPSIEVPGTASQGDGTTAGRPEIKTGVPSTPPIPVNPITSDQPYTYKPLDPSNAEYRVLMVNGHFSDDAPIVCELLHQSLAVEPGTVSQQLAIQRAAMAAARKGIKPPDGSQVQLRRFSALSYTWGRVDRTEQIVLSGHRFPVTRNLYSALKRMRRSKQGSQSHPISCYLWVDAICVNQNDLVERGQQVGFMRRIYRRAATVDVWLGDEVDGSAEAMALIGKLQQPPQRGPGLPEAVYPEVSDEQRRANWKSLELLFRRPWWERCWVRQEVALANSVMIHCGNASAPLYSVIAASKILAYVTEGLRFQPLGFSSRFPSRESSFVFVGEDEATAAAAAAVSISHVHNPPHHQASLLADITSKTGQGSVFMDLKDLLVHTRTCRATDPRDKIFSVLGLADPAIHKVVVDYSEQASTREVFMNATRSVLANTKALPLDILSACQNPNRDYNLPSWVPNLLEEWKYRPISANHFSSSRSDLREMDFSVAPLGDKLRVKGVSLGAVDLICQDSVPEFASRTQLHQVYERWQEFASAILESLGEHRMDRDDHEHLRLGVCGRWREQSWLTFLSTGRDSIHLLAYDGDDKVRRSDDQDMRHRVPDKRFVKCLLVPEDAIEEDVETNPYEYLYANLNTTCYGRRLAFSKKGLMGLVPGDVRKGDKFVWMYGTVGGFVLREVEKKSGEEQEEDEGEEQSREKHYVVVGDAYLPRVENRRSWSADDHEYFCLV